MESVDELQLIRASPENHLLPESGKESYTMQLTDAVLPDNDPHEPSNPTVADEILHEPAMKIAERVFSAPVLGGSKKLSTSESTLQYTHSVGQEPSEGWINSRKRLHSIRDPDQGNRGIDSGHFGDAENDQNGSFHDHHDQKRSRPSEWPLKTAERTNEPIPSANPRQKQSSRSLKPKLKHKTLTPARPSRFVEGSMNDRVSNRPPSVYTREDEVMDQFLADHGHASTVRLPGSTANKTQVGGLTRNSNESISTKPQRSGMLGFGKTILHEFNPVTIWTNLVTIWKETGEEYDPALRLMRERQVKAEKQYAEYKKNGQFGSQGTSRFHYVGDVAAVSYQPKEVGPPPSLHRDSGIDVDGYRISGEQMRDSKLAQDEGQLMPPPAIGRSVHTESPMSDTSSAPKSSSRFKKPTVTSLEKVKSNVQLSSMKPHFPLIVSPPLPDSSTHKQDVQDDQGVRKQPSRKDLQKQQKLSKKVSDLESKLEVARWELNQALGEAPSVQSSTSHVVGRRPFVPGALPTLPSQRLLLRNLGTEKGGNDGDGSSELSEAVIDQSNTTSIVSKQSKVAQKELDIGGPKVPDGQQSTPESKTPHGTRTRPSPRKNNAKRRNGESDNSIYKPHAETDDDAEWEAAKTPPKRKAGRPRKSMKLNQHDSPAFTLNGDGKEEMRDQGHPILAKGNSSSKSVLVYEKSFTDLTSVTHLGQPAPGLLSRPRPASPLRASKLPRRSTSPPPAEEKLKSEARLSSVIEGVISVTPRNGAVPPISKVPHGLKRNAKMASLDMDPLADIEDNVDPVKKPAAAPKEEYQWPEDVF
ncbi:MAG: hypothetical protein M1827_002176 [Pycnora praestabilis]|nr:MAG: hypothetical protein M1827_002176 [Pycnora praestabilis]